MTRKEVNLQDQQSSIDLYKTIIATRKTKNNNQPKRNRTRNETTDDLTDRDAQSQSDRDLRSTQGVRSQQIPPRKAKVSKDIDKTFENCQVCGGSFKKGRGLRIHLAKSKAGCKRILEGRIYNKSRTGSSQDQHHSGSTSKNIPDTATFEDAPQQEEMWSIFSTYPETVSQCVGRKLKELRLEASRIALHDDVEKEVKERIAEEERAQNDVLVIDNEEEQRIDGDIEYRSEVEIEIVGVESEDIEQIVKGHKVKSIVTKPDIRDWLKSNATSKK